MDSGDNGDRRSRRTQGLKPEFGQLPPRTRKVVVAGQDWTRQEVTVKSDRTQRDEQKSSSILDPENMSQHGSDSWLMKFSANSSRKSMQSNASQRRRELEVKSKYLDERQKAEAKFAADELQRKIERLQLNAELEMAKMEEDESRSQYLSSDEDDEKWQEKSVYNIKNEPVPEISAADKVENFLESTVPRYVYGDSHDKIHHSLFANHNKETTPGFWSFSPPGKTNQNSERNSKQFVRAQESQSRPEPLVQGNIGRQPEPQQLPEQKMVPFSADQLSLLFQAQDIAKSQQTVGDTGGGEIKKFVARQSGVTVLPDFSGEPEKWPMYINHYLETTKECGYSDFNNICRLRKSLKGKALEAVGEMLNHTDKLPLIIKCLEENFGQPDLIVKTLILKAKKIASFKEDKYDAIIDFSHTVINLVATMESLRKENYMVNPTLMEELVEKLPVTFRTEWGNEMARKSDNSENVTLKDFSEWMGRRAKTARILKTTLPIESAPPKAKQDEIRSNKPDSRKSKGQKKESVFAASEPKDEEKTTPEVKCLFCEGSNHKTFQCKKFAKLDDATRWKWATDNRVCFSCLGGGHSMRACETKEKCLVSGCQLFHHKLLHKEKVEDKPEATPEVVTTTTGTKIVTSTTLRRVMPVILKGPKCELRVYAMLDSGSTVTLMDSKLAEQLGLCGPRTGLLMTMVDGTTATESKSKIFPVKIQGLNEKESFTMDSVRTVRKLKLPPQSVNMEEMFRKFKHLRKLPVESMNMAVPRLLIGDDQCHLTVARDVREGPLKAPIASHTKLGWVVHGPEEKTENVGECVFHIRHAVEEKLCQLVRDSFSTESFGVRASGNLPKSVATTKAEQQIAATMKRNGEKWETGLLWAEDNVQMPPSRISALIRLKSLQRRMSRDEDLSQWYHEKINHYITSGYVRKLSDEEARVSGPRTWYLPHFAAEHPNKPGKRRLVFDAAAKCFGVSLNDKLLSGPDLLTSLTGVLLRFRKGRIGFSGDIREMFHQVRIRKEDRCAQRFLWNETGVGSPSTYEMQVMTFGATCSPCLAQVAKNTNAMEYAEEFPEAAEAIVRKHYVDDYLDGADSDDEALKIIRDVIEVHRRGGFEIRGWICSSRSVLHALSGTSNINEEKDLNLEGEHSSPKVLGLRWNPNEDYFYFSCHFNKVDSEIVGGERRPTKREVLKTFMSVFDPLGFVVHFTVKARILFQQVWRSGISWDDEITDVQFVKWRTWLRQMRSIGRIGIPRCYSSLLKDAENIQLHVFCDSSEEAFAAVAYLRIQSGDTVDTVLVMARARVAPLKPITIPRLELQAALMGSRLAATLNEELDLKIQETHYWSDSRTVLCWIRSDARQYKPFVACRVGEILETTSIENWHWVPTKENAADEATRSSTEADFSSGSRWLRGPEFLKLRPEDWPKEKKAVESDDEIESSEICCGVDLTKPILPNIATLNSWSRLLRSTAWMLRFIDIKLMKKKISGELNVEELQRAERVILRRCQKETSDRVNIPAQKKVPGLTKVLGLCPAMDEHGLLRVRGRVRESPELALDARQPILLSPKHDITRLLVKHYHCLVGHAGQEFVLNELRQKYWILDARSAVRYAWYNCNFCKIARAKPEFPEMAPLPKVRLTRPPRPFTYVGVDYFGPLTVTVNRGTQKRYGVLFTCLSVRAVHLEIASSLSTDSFIMALRRFIGRRGCPTKIYSDNGTNFHGANNELKRALEEFDQNEIERKLSSKGIEWTFIPPSAPHMGGTWERLVKSVKVALTVNLKEQSPREEVLHTLFVEAENTVNSRPLTRVSADPNDLESLTPNHFLLGSSAGAPNMAIHPREDLFSRKQWRIAQAFADQFWKRWIKEYQPSLTKRTKWHKPTKPVKLGDLVFIADGDLPRNSWPRGKIIEVFPGKDGVIRVVKVKTATGEFRRPLVKICVLDVEPEKSAPSMDCGDEDGIVDKPEDLPPGGVYATLGEDKYCAE